MNVIDKRDNLKIDDTIAHMSHHPYWKRAHRDWRVWVAVFVIMAAMTIYVMSDNLTWWPYR